MKVKRKGPGSATVRRIDKKELARRGEKLEEVTLAGPETGARRITGQPDYGMAPDYNEDCGCDHDEKPKMKLVMKMKEERSPEYPKALLRGDKRNREIEEKRPKNWTDEVTEKPSLLDRLRKKKV